MPSLWCNSRETRALLARKHLRFRCHGRARDDTTDRTVTPQRLVHCRDKFVRNEFGSPQAGPSRECGEGDPSGRGELHWYLDAWDHGKRALRAFSVERVRNPHPLDARATDIPEQRLDRHYSERDGIFAGRPRHKALLRFTPDRARRIAEEHGPSRHSGAGRKMATTCSNPARSTNQAGMMSSR